jgi:hypothetical protein
MYAMGFGSMYVGLPGLTCSRPPDRPSLRKEIPVALFLVKHQHPAETCPAGDARMAPMLLQHLSPENAA